ncbi:MAG TPA: LysR family transcriptional regulator [Desulfobacteraceae bacterium]|nr:LysR family transcriptional regulator [Desulfobacteraceae bacterium]
MGTANQNFVIRSKIWIEDDHGNVVFGDGRYRILKMVDEMHSLQGAAKELKMSYRALWGRIKASEERIGKSLVAREGRGSCLTPFARKLMRRYLELQSSIRKTSDGIYDDLISDHLDL